MFMIKKPISTLTDTMKKRSLQGSISAFFALEVLDIYEVDIIGVECEDEFVGVFTRSDFERNVIRRNLNPRHTTLYEVITLNPPRVPSDTSVKDTYEAMLAYQWDYMPVVDGNHLCGIVSMNDLGHSVVHSLEEMKTENDTIMDYLHGGESYAMASYRK